MNSFQEFIQRFFFHFKLSTVFILGIILLIPPFRLCSLGFEFSSFSQFFNFINFLYFFLFRPGLNVRDNARRFFNVFNALSYVQFPNVPYTLFPFFRGSVSVFSDSEDIKLKITSYFKSTLFVNGL